MQSQFLKLVLPAFLFLFAVVFILIFSLESHFAADNTQGVPQFGKGGVAQRPNTLESVTVKLEDSGENIFDNQKNSYWNIKAEKTIIELDVREYQTYPLDEAEVVVKLGSREPVSFKTNSQGIARINYNGTDKPTLTVLEVKDFKCANCPLVI